jgi:hypothetical protein
MSYANASTSASPNFQSILNNALETYNKRTKNDLLTHPLIAELQHCTSPSAILALIHQQVQGLQRDDDRLTKWLDPTVRVLLAFSDTLGEGISLVCLVKSTHPRFALSYPFHRHSLQRKRSLQESVFFSQCVFLVRLLLRGIVISFQAAMDVRACQDTLIHIFERMENFFQRLEIYTRVSPPPEMIDIIVKIMVEVISILGVATKEMKQGRTSK